MAPVLSSVSQLEVQNATLKCFENCSECCVSIVWIKMCHMELDHILCSSLWAIGSYLFALSGNGCATQQSSFLCFHIFSQVRRGKDQIVRVKKNY